MPKDVLQNARRWVSKAAGARRAAPGAGRGGQVVIATRLYAPEPTPAAFRHEALFDELGRRGIDTTVLTTTAPGHPAAEDSGVSRWPVLRDAQGHVKGYASYLSYDIPLFLRLLAVRDPKVVVSEPPPTTGFVVLVSSMLRRVPYVYYAADVWADATRTVQGVPALVPAILGLVERLVWRRASLVLAISPGVQHRIEELIGDASPVVMVGNGIRVEDFSAEGPERETAAPPTFLYTGTVSEWHGASVFVDAFARVRERHGEARLIFFSEGAEKDALERRVRENGTDGIEFRPRVTTSELSGHLRGAVASLASVFPGQGYDFAIPTKIYASTASGTPVVYAGLGPSVDLVRDNGLGWAVDYSVDDVADAMDEAIRARQEDRMPSPAALRDWTVQNASLAASASTIVDAMGPYLR